VNRTNFSLLIGFLGLAFAGGLFDSYFHEGGRLYGAYNFSINIGTILIIFIWYRLDAAEIGYRASPMLNIMVVGATLLALPYYFFRSRGTKKGGIFLVIFIAALFLYGIADRVGTYIGDKYIHPFPT